MKIFGALVALLGGLIHLLVSGGVYAAGQAASTEDTMVSEFLSGFGSIGTGVAIFILILSGFAFVSSGRFAGVLLILLSVIGFFTGGGFIMALPFFGGLLCMAGGGNRVTMGSNYT